MINGLPVVTDNECMRRTKSMYSRYFRGRLIYNKIERGPLSRRRRRL